ncbi:MAG: DNA-3-methyladenine glycosylase 2 family protein [Patescibacteria group bacterium]|nr:DNA-3-methyladenine glycosylase 2 family protein [Patescibacteria group bacterium]MDE2116545.1 DNA-3-methyladenine glycosylase 2 family protein [Patescibacteria group bacterium]
MYSKARLHFKKNDPILHKASLEFEIEDLKESDDVFRDIVWTIIGQQLSGKAADTIFGRFIALFPGRELEPRRILKLSDSAMRACGLSGAKARAIKSFAEHMITGRIDLDRLPTLSDAEVLAELTKVKGIGPWTAEMILMFSLGRADIFSAGDLGLRKGLMHLYGLKKAPSDSRIAALTSRWSPYRTYGARILWRIADKKKARL